MRNNPYISLTVEETQKLKQMHKTSNSSKKRDRIKAILMLSKGFSYTEVAEHLLLDEDTVSTIKTRYEEDGIDQFVQDNYVCYA